MEKKKKRAIKIRNRRLHVSNVEKKDIIQMNVKRNRLVTEKQLKHPIKWHRISL